jgi:hypothetical protein
MVMHVVSVNRIAIQAQKTLFGKITKAKKAEGS